MLKLRDFVQVNYDEEKILIFYRDGIRIDNTEENMKFINDLINGITESEYVNKYSGYKKIIDIMEKHNFISSYISDEKRSVPEQKLLWYLDQFNESPELLYGVLQKSRVCIIGLGGIGGNILKMLVSSGIKNYILIDFDVVEYHNLNRQYMYSVNDVGRLKTEICREKLEEFDYTINCVTYNSKVDSYLGLKQLLKNEDFDVIVSAADTPNNIADIIRMVAKDKHCAFSAGGLGIDVGQYIFTKPDEIDNYIMGKPLDGMETIERKVIKGSFGPTNEIVSSYMSMDIVYYLIGQNTWSGGKTVVFDFFEKKTTYLS